MLWLATAMTLLRPVDPPEAVGYVVPVVLTVAVVLLSLGTRWVLVKVGVPWLFALPRPLAYRSPRRDTASA
jgi:hypothetical protein